MLKRAIRHENQREHITKHQERYRSAAKYKLASQRQSIEQHRQMMLHQAATLLPAMQSYYHEVLSQLAVGTRRANTQNNTKDK